MFHKVFNTKREEVKWPWKIFETRNRSVSEWESHIQLCFTRKGWREWWRWRWFISRYWFVMIKCASFTHDKDALEEAATPRNNNMWRWNDHRRAGSSINLQRHYQRGTRSYCQCFLTFFFFFLCCPDTPEFSSKSVWYPTLKCPLTTCCYHRVQSLSYKLKEKIVMDIRLNTTLDATESHIKQCTRLLIYFFHTHILIYFLDTPWALNPLRYPTVVFDC